MICRKKLKRSKRFYLNSRVVAPVLVKQQALGGVAPVLVKQQALGGVARVLVKQQALGGN